MKLLTRRPQAGGGLTVSPLERVVSITGLTRTGLIVLGLSLPIWGAARLIGGRTIYLFVYGTILVLVISRWLGRRRPALEARRSEIPTRVRQGQRVEVEVEVTARRRVGTFLLEEKLHPHLGRHKRIPLSQARRGEPVRHRYAITARLRGVYEVGPLTAVWTDPFGLTERQAELVPAYELIVHPTTEMVHDRPLTRQWEDPPIRPPVSKPWPTGFEFYGMRHYAPGDDLRRIVWRAVARTGQVMVRESEQGITDRVTIVLDTDGRFHSPGYPSDTFEAAVKTAASLGVRHLKDGFEVTVESNGAKLGSGWRGSSAQVRLLDELARLQPDEHSLSSAIDRMVAEPRRDVHTLVITPHLDDAAAARIRLLMDRGASVVLVVVVWEESDPRTLSAAASLGCQVVQLRPQTPLEAVFARGVGAGKR